MANEYLKRTPTSSGNRKVFTFSVWYKRLSDNGATTSRYFFLAGDTHINLRGSGATNPDDFITNQRGQGTNYFYHYAPARRDYSSWQHLLYAVDTTQSIEKNRGRVYINGVEQLESSSLGSSNAPLNDELSINKTVAHFISEDGGDDGTYPSSLQLSDAFLVDGQALTPDVFGFYKDGDGYMSSGTTQATDFRPGQWSPRLPKSIKYTINSRGGFGVNGFYLPMNDSSNPGADFHCAPNSIIKLKGEDLPQPRNGAPTTTDLFVSQLRSDPFAANLVLAVPGISLQTGNLISNGNFENSNFGGWTITGSDTRASFFSPQGSVSLVLLAYGTTGGMYQSFTTEVGKTYKVSLDSDGGPSVRIFNGSGVSGTTLLTMNLNNSGGYEVGQTGTFTATSTTSTFAIVDILSGAAVQVDNIGVFDNNTFVVETVKDYSADIKGSGTNKTLTAAGKAGIGYELGGYYGSAMTFYNDGTNGAGNTDVINVPTSSDFVFNGDVTMEGWIYPTGTPSTAAIIFGQWLSGGGTNRNFNINFDTSNRLIAYFNSSATNYDTGTSPVLALNQWYHVAAEKYGSNFTLYVNGVAVGVNANTPTAGNTSTVPFTIGSESDGSNGADYGFNGRIQDVRVYKGVAKYKGGFDVPKPYTPVGIEAFRTTTDTCKNNFATLNPLFPYVSSNTYTNGNLRAEATTNNQVTTGNMAFSSGKWYWETRIFNDEMIGLGIPSQSILGYPGANSNGFSYHQSGSVYYGATGPIGYGAGWAGSTYRVIGLAVDWTNRRAYWHVDGVWANSADPSAGTGFYNITTNAPNVAASVDALPAWRSRSASPIEHVSVNFGQNPSFDGILTAGTFTDDSGKGLFKYAPPTGFLALCSDNLPTPAIADPGEHFKTVLYEGDGSSGRSITGVGFQPDLVWIKSRDAGLYHLLTDSVRGVDNTLSSNTNDNEAFSTERVLNSFDNDGFSLNADDGSGYYGWNVNGQNMVAWCWKAGGAAVSNTDGTITSQVSANQTAGFSIATWTSTGSNDALQTVGHGLDTAPNMIILKNRDAAVNWRVYHSGIPSPNNSLCLNTTEVAFNFFPSVGDDTFGLANSTTTGQSSGASGQDIVAYCWTEIEGFSKFGSYVGNESTNGPFVYCGFKPAWVMIKAATDNSPYQAYASWGIKDSSRYPSNINDVPTLWANENYGEGKRGNGDSDTYDEHFDFLSNGFKIGSSASYEVESNKSGVTYIFMAFAESPFKTANAK